MASLTNLWPWNTHNQWSESVQQFLSFGACAQKCPLMILCSTQVETGQEPQLNSHDSPETDHSNNWVFQIHYYSLWKRENVPFSVSMYWSDCVSMRLAVTCVFRACFCFRITGRWNRKLYDTLAWKWHRTQPLCNTSTCCPQPSAGEGLALGPDSNRRGLAVQCDVSATLRSRSSLVGFLCSWPLLVYLCPFSLIKSITREKWIVCLLLLFIL